MARVDRFALYLMGALATYALGAIAYFSLHPALGRIGNLLASMALAVALVATSLLLSEPVSRTASRLALLLNRIPRRVFWATLLIAAFGGRIALYALLQPVATSDAAIYVALGQQLAEHGNYVQPPDAYDPSGCLACYPPGLPLLLGLLYKLLGNHDWIPLCLNLLVLGCQLVVLRPLHAVLRLPSAYRLSALALLLWPSLFLYSLTPNKELLVGLAVSAAVLIQLRLLTSGARLSTRTVWLSAATGVLCGVASLAQPAWLLFPIALAVFALVAGLSRPAAAAGLGAAVLAMALTIAPWTVRNMHALGAFVPISTSGGFNFYMVNNPQATGSWTNEMERSLKGYGELERNRLGMQWGKEWIARHPVQFGLLAIKKQLMVLGADDTGAYWAIERGTELRGLALSAAWLLSTVFWAALWMLILSGSSQCLRSGHGLTKAAIVLVGPLLYLLAVHGVFEAQAKHHLNVSAIIVLLACALPLAASPAQRES